MSSEETQREVQKGKLNVQLKKLKDAILIGASEGDLINITGKNFEFTGIAHVNGIHQGMVASTSLFGSLIESMSNSEYTDPVTNLQSLVLSPVNVKKIAGSKKE